MDKVKEFWNKYKLYIIIGICFILLEAGLITLGNYYHEQNVKGKEQQIKQLGIVNKQLIKEKKIVLDSLEYFHLQALIQNNRDTIYVNRISYLKTKNHEDLKTISHLSSDSSLLLYSKLSEEYISTGFNK